MKINVKRLLQRPSWMPRWFNWPLVIFIAFMGMLFFSGDNNFMQVTHYKKQIRDLKIEIKNNEDSALMYNRKVNELNTDRETMERIARETYHMKRPNEEVYITEIP